MFHTRLPMWLNYCEWTLDRAFSTISLNTVAYEQSEIKAGEKKRKADRKWHVRPPFPQHKWLAARKSLLHVTLTLDTQPSTFRGTSGNPATTHFYTTAHNQIGAHIADRQHALSSEKPISISERAPACTPGLIVPILSSHRNCSEKKRH